MFDCQTYMKDVLVNCISTAMEKISRSEKIVEIEELKMERRKFNLGHFVKGHRVLMTLSAEWFVLFSLL